MFPRVPQEGGGCRGGSRYVEGILGFLVSLFQSFLVSGFQSFLAAWFHSFLISKFQSLKDLPNLHFMLSGRY